MPGCTSSFIKNFSWRIEILSHKLLFETVSRRDQETEIFESVGVVVVERTTYSVDNELVREALSVDDGTL